MHPSTKIFHIECGEQIFDPFIESIPRKMQRCVVYVLDMIDTPFVKIGSTSNPRSRIKTYATASPFLIECPFIFCPPFGLAHTIIELEAHKIMSPSRFRGEWFKATRQDAICAIIAANNRMIKGVLL